MIVACVFGALIEYPASPVRHLLPPAWLRRIVMGFAIGVVAMALIDSPWGRRSGAHLNPAVTITFWWVRKVHAWDAVFYVVAQFVGGAVGVWLAARVVGAALADLARTPFALYRRVSSLFGSRSWACGAQSSSVIRAGM